MKMPIVALLVFLVGVVQGGQSKFCCFPDQWEVTEGLITGSSDNKGNSAIVLGTLKMSFDATGRRVHVDEYVTERNVTRNYAILQLFNEKVQYIIHNGTCTRAVLGPWNNLNCIPDDATLFATYMLGNKQHIQIKEYTWIRDTLQLGLSVTDQCVPVFEKQSGSVDGANIMSGHAFQDATPGIADPSVFVVPDICKKALEVPVQYVYRRSTMF